MLVVRTESEDFEKIFEDAYKGKGTTLIVSGESGIGKSFFINNFIEKKLEDYKKDKRAELRNIVFASGENNRILSDPLNSWKELVIDIQISLATIALLNGEAESAKIDVKKLIKNIFIKQSSDWFKLIPVVGDSASTLVKAIKGIFDEKEAQKKANESFFPDSNVVFETPDDKYKILMKKLRDLSEHDLYILFIKNIQYFDNESLDLFYKLSKNLSEEPYRMLLIGSYCKDDLIKDKIKESGIINILPIEEALSNLSKSKSINEINLKVFSPEQIELFLNMKFPGNDFTLEFKKDVEKISNGIPLYLDEVTTHFKDCGIIYFDKEDSKFKNFKSSEQFSLPKNLEEILEKRYDSLGDALTPIINIASVMGNDFSFEIISKVTEKKLINFDVIIDKLKNKHKLIEKVKKTYPKMELIYRFIHYLYQKYVYDKLLLEEFNIVIHKQISVALKNMYPEEMINSDILEQYIHHLGIGNRIISDKGEVILNKDNLRDDEVKNVVNEFTNIYQKLTEGYEKTISYEEAINKCRILISIYEILEDKELRFEYNLKLAIFLKDANKWSESGSEFNNALKIAEELNDKPKIALCYLEMSNLFENTKESDEAINCLNKFLKISEELKDENLLTRAYVTFGNIYRNKLNNEEALINYRKALDYRQRRGDEQKIGVIYLNMGNVYYIQSELSNALEYYLKAKKIFEISEDKKHLPKVIKNIGNIYFIKRQFDEALTQYNTAKVKFNESGNIKEEADIFVNTGSVNYYLRKTDLSIEYYEKALEIYKKLGEKENKAKCLKNLGLCFIEKKDLDKALEFFQQASKINHEIKSKVEEASCDFEMGDIYFIKNNIETAFEFYDKAIKLLKEIPKANNLPSFLFRKANSLYKLKNFDEAGRINTEAKDAALKTEKSDIVFGSELLNAKLISVTDKTKSINLLNDLLTTIKDEQERAEVYCELFKISGENEYRIKSYDIYTKLNTDNPCEEYLQKINELK